MNYFSTNSKAWRRLVEQMRAMLHFFNIKRRILTQADCAHLTLPQEILDVVDRFGHAGASAGETQSANPWLIVAQATRGLLLKAGGFSLLTALANAGSVVVGMKILGIKSGMIEISTICMLIALFFGFSLLSVYGNLMGNRYRGWLGLAAETVMAHRLTAKLWRIRHRSLQQMPSGSLKVLVNSDARNVANFVNIAVRNVLPVLTASLVAVPLLAVFAGWAGLAGFATMLLLIPISTVLARGGARYQRRIQVALDRLTALTGEWVTNIRLIRYLDWERAILRDLGTHMRRLTILSMKQSSVSFVAAGLSVSWWMISIAMVALTARLIDIPVDLGQFFGAIWLITLLHGYLMHVPTTIRFYAQAEISMHRLQQFLDQPEQSSLFLPDQQIMLDDVLPTHVHFEDVSFYYDSAVPILQGLSFSVDLGKKTALLGEIGAGKTCLLNLLLGDEAPNSGRIVIEFDDGRRLDLWQRQVHLAFRQHLAMVPQEAFLSNDDLLTNIVLGPEAREDEAFQAAYAAELAADLEQLPDGMRTEIGEGGINLSGGQRQRVNLARAFYSRRRYLLLDDPTSAVDPKVELRLIEQLMRCPGFLLVSHRIGAVRGVDQVLILKNTRLVEQGSPQALDSDPASHFRRMCSAYGSQVSGEQD
jgi:ABC-type multidrug transport system fused ATPase/permease subunit